MSDDLIDVQLLGLPVAVQAEAAQHHDELMREFSDLAALDTTHREVPARLVSLQFALQERFAGFVKRPDSELAAAKSRGDETVDLRYRVPRAAADAAASLERMLEEVDTYCEAGEYLLTLKTPPRPLLYRQWFVAQFVSQAAGEDPVSWSDWVAGR